MIQEIVVLRVTDKDGKPIHHVVELAFSAEKSNARAKAAEMIAEIEDGDFLVTMSLGEALVSRTKRVVSGVKSTRAKAAPNGKGIAKQPRKKRGLSLAAKLAKVDEAAFLRP
jgi:hypothetical protein